MAQPLTVSTLRVSATGASSASLQEARHKALEFFRAICRAAPALVGDYNLEDVVTVPQLRSNVADQFRKHAAVSNPQVVDMLVYKGREELENFTSHSKQRHHILGSWMVGMGAGGTRSDTARRFGLVDHGGESEFLKRFYQGNN